MTLLLKGQRTTLDAVGNWEECATGMGDVLLFLKLAILYPLLQLTGSTVGNESIGGLVEKEVRFVKVVEKQKRESGYWK